MSPYPHHVVSLGYNTVPDGRDFSDNNVDWNPPNQKKYSRGHNSSPTFIPLSAYNFSLSFGGECCNHSIQENR